MQHYQQPRSVAVLIILLALISLGAACPPTGARCRGFAASGLPKTIDDKKQTSVSITVADTGVISSVSIQLSMVHQWATDVNVELMPPNRGPMMLLAPYWGGAIQLDNVDFCDAASIFPEEEPLVTGSYRPVDTMSDLAGYPADGVWTLRLTDKEERDAGTIDAFVITLCFSTPTNVTHVEPAAYSASSSDVNTPEQAFHGGIWRSTGFPTQWIEVDYGQPVFINRAQLKVDMNPDGACAHIVTGGMSPAPTTQIHTAAAFYAHGESLRWLLTPGYYRYVRITTTLGPSRVAWRNIRLAPATAVVATGTTGLVAGDFGTTGSCGSSTDRYASVLWQSSEPGFVRWSSEYTATGNPGHALASEPARDSSLHGADGSLVRVVLAPGETSRQLFVSVPSSYNRVPSSSRIEEIRVKINRWAVGAGALADTQVALVLNGQIVAPTNRCPDAAECAWKTSSGDQYIGAGTWGLAAGVLTPDVVNSNDFAVVFQTRNTGSDTVEALFDLATIQIRSSCGDAPVSATSGGSEDVLSRSAKKYPRYFFRGGSPNWMQGWSADGSSVASMCPTAAYAAGAGLDTSLNGRDKRYVVATLEPGQSSSLLHVVRFSGNAVPAAATITGIQVILVRYAAAALGSSAVVRDTSMRLTIDGVTTIGERYTALEPSAPWPKSERVTYAGGLKDLWGLAPGSLTPAMLNTMQFGVAFVTKNYHSSMAATAYINEVNLVVGYTINAADWSPSMELEMVPEDDVLPAASGSNGASNSDMYVAVTVPILVALAVAAVVVVVVYRRRQVVPVVDLPREDTEADLNTTNPEDVVLSVASNPLFDERADTGRQSHV